MAKGKTPEFEVTCPACRAILTVDPEVKTVLHHRPPPRTGPASSLDTAMEALKGAKAQREVRFRDAAAAEKNKEAVLGRKFEAGLKRATDMPDPGPRPIDLD